MRRIPPDSPPDSHVRLSPLVPTRIDRNDARDLEIPLERRGSERSEESARGSVDVNGDGDARASFVLVQESGHLLDVLCKARSVRNWGGAQRGRTVVARVGRTEDDEDSDRVLLATTQE